MSEAAKGAMYGSVIPGMGTLAGAGVGSLFKGKKKSSAPASDPYANEWQSQEGINTIADRIKNGQFQFGNTSDKAATVIKDYLSIYGRVPTPTEINMALPAAQEGKGGAFIATQKYAEDNSPEKLYAKQQEEYLANAPKHFDSVNQMFQSSLGRTATQDELNHFGALLSSGTTDQYQLQQFLDQQPEATQKKDQAFQDELSGKLQGYDQRYYSEKILPSIQEAYAKQGRSFDSSAFQNAATQSAGQQNTQREQYLAQLSASQYGGRQQNAYNDYAQQVQNQQNLTNSGIQAQYAGIQNNVSRSNQYADYSLQKDAYNQYLAKYGKRGNAIAGGLQGAMSGAMAGGMAGGPWGALAGGIGGAALGAYGSSQGGSY